MYMCVCIYIYIYIHMGDPAVPLPPPLGLALGQPGLLYDFFLCVHLFILVSSFLLSSLVLFRYVCQKVFLYVVLYVIRLIVHLFSIVIYCIFSIFIYFRFSIFIYFLVLYLGQAWFMTCFSFSNCLSFFDLVRIPFYFKQHLLLSRLFKFFSCIFVAALFISLQVVAWLSRLSRAKVMLGLGLG